MRTISPPGKVQQLGRVTCPSGVMVILDGGLAWMWSHDRPPILPEWSEISTTANSSVDLAVVGPDAVAAGLAFDRSNHPLFLYDRDPEPIIRSFHELLAERGFDAQLERLAARVPHRKRVDLALEHGGGLGVVEFHGMWAAAIGGLPRGGVFSIMGERMPAGPDEDRWRRVWIQVRQGKTASVRRIGHVLVDEARLMAVDSDALGAWDDHEPQDGCADVVFWGRDAAVVAGELAAPEVCNPGEANRFGWLDLPLDEALERGRQVEAARSAERKFAFDFRPHTHHWQVMRDVRASSTESGVLELQGAELCMFMTSWGDGAFPIEADLDAGGRAIRVRIEVGSDEIVERQREMEELWFGEFSKLGMVSARVARDRQAVRFLYRQAPDNEADSGWRLFAGDETDSYSNDPDNVALLPLREVIEHDRTLKQILRTAAPCAFERETPELPFRVAEGFEIGDG